MSDCDELKQRLARTLEGRYKITRLLGRGGMAVVFLAQDLVLERQVAIKVLPPDMTRDPQLIRRFKQEGKTAAKLDHPNIIPIYRVESEGELAYIVMKYVSGHSLEDLMAKGPLPIPSVRHILREAALALGHAHRRRIVHRDVKPANIMVEEDGRVILTDFGISKAVQGTTQLTSTGTIIGTPHYMAPEQARGQEVDGRADQYALGIVAYRILAGKPPFDGDAHSILYQQVFEAPPSLLERRPDTPSDLNAVVGRALAKDVKARFSTMEEFAAAVSGERTGSTTAISGAAVTRKALQPARVAGNNSGSLVALATIALVAGGIWVSLPTLQGLTSHPASGRSTAVVPAPSAIRSARLTVSSDPQATVYLNGVKLGLTPVSNHRLPFGTHRLRIQRAGYQPLSEVLVVKGTAPITRKYGLRRVSRR